MSVLFLLLGKGVGFIPPLFFCLIIRVINFFVYIYISNNDKNITYEDTTRRSKRSSNRSRSAAKSSN